MREAQDDENHRFARVIRGRAKARRSRAAEAGLIAVLVWISTHSPLVGAWLLATLIAGVLEGVVGGRVLASPDPAGPRGRAAFALAFSAATYVSIAALIIAPRPTASGLAGAAVLLCAVALNNAIQSAGSRLATASLVTPPAALLIAAPLYAAIAGSDIDVANTLLLALGGIAFTAFIIHLSASMAAERDALRLIGQEAKVGNERWGMVFDNSPVALICFDASALHERLHRRMGPGARLGDAARDEYATYEALYLDCPPIEANAAARSLFSRYGGLGKFGPDFLQALCDGLDGMDAHGNIPRSRPR